MAGIKTKDLIAVHNLNEENLWFSINTCNSVYNARRNGPNPPARISLTLRIMRDNHIIL